MSKADENKALLRTSLDYTVCKRELIGCGLLLAVLACFLTLISLLVQSFRLLLLLIPVAAFCVPLAIIQLCRMSAITKNCDEVVFCETVLTDPQPHFNATICFKVTVQTDDGSVFSAETAPFIAAMRGMLKPHFSELNNKKALVAYKAETEQVIVIKTL